jgi:Tfp pilus assembly protein PilN
VKQINLLPWRELKSKLKKRQFVIVWLCVSCSCLILLFTEKILIIQQIKHYQLAHGHILLQLKATSLIVHEIKKLQYEEKELTKIIKIIHSNHQQIKKILDFINHLKYLISPDIFVRLIEFHPPYLRLIMHANSEEKYLTLIRAC